MKFDQVTKRNNLVRLEKYLRLAYLPAEIKEQAEGIG
jgi:hypothetical protein